MCCREFLNTKDDKESDELDEGMKSIVSAMIKEREENVMKVEANAYGNDFSGHWLRSISMRIKKP